MTRRTPAFALAAVFALAVLAPIPVRAEEPLRLGRSWWSLLTSWLVPQEDEAPGASRRGAETIVLPAGAMIDPVGRTTATSPVGDTTDYDGMIGPVG
jgi:hypothetical protein